MPVSFEQLLKRRQLTRRLSRVTTALVLVAVAAFVITFWTANDPIRKAEIAEPRIVPQQVADGKAAGEIIDLEYFVSRREQMAKLTSTVSVLANAPTLADDTKSAQRYLERHYGANSPRENISPVRSE